MNKLLTTAATAALLTAGLSTPAWAAAPEAPTDVQVSWTDDGKVRVTWKDNGEANQVVAAFPDTGYRLAMPTADAPNELLLSPSAFQAAAEARVSVRTLAADGTPSEPAHSPLFDTWRVSAPALWGATSLSSTSLRLTWNQEAIAEATPNDPMDQPAGAWLKATTTGPAAGQQTAFLIPGGAKWADVPIPAGPVTVKLSAGNEWGVANASDFQTVRVGTTRVSTVFPTRANFSAFRVDGTLQMSEVPLGETYGFQIQARANSSAPWQQVGAAYSEKPGASIPAWAGAAGGQEYRLWVAPTESLRDDVFLVLPAASTSAKYVRKSAYIAAGFAPNTARVSATVHLKVNATPSLPLKAALQKWNGKQWMYLRAVQLDAKGRADIAIRAAGRGTTTKYRILTPPVKVKGLPVEASTSTPFTLKVV